MKSSTMMKSLKEVNQQASEVAKQIAETTDPQIIYAIIAQYGNECWTKGVNEGQGLEDNGAVRTTRD